MKRELAVRTEKELLPSFYAFVDEIDKNGISPELLYKIIQRHRPNAQYNRALYNRYMAVAGGVPIFDRMPRYDDDPNPINNKVNSDFFGEIVDFSTGYFAGEPISYSYSRTAEAEGVTGGAEAVDAVSKRLTDFTVRSNMFGVDMETTKNAKIYGYSGRLFYIDPDGQERVMAVPGYETIILSKTDIAEPKYAVRYYETAAVSGKKTWTVEFYDNTYIYTYEGLLSRLSFVSQAEHGFDYCPLQGIENNKECMGDAEKVLTEIDDYDKVLSDNSNELEAFVHAMLLIALDLDDDEARKAQKSGILIVPQVGANPVQDPAKWVTKNINDAFTEHHLQRVEDNIYRFSKTPNLNDQAFGTASGVALKFKLHGLETKCAMFEASMMNAAQHMWRVLCSSWNKRGLNADPLQFCMEFHRNFPLDKLSEAQAAQAWLAAKMPMEWVVSQIAGVDDPQYVLDMIEQETGDVAGLYDAAAAELDMASAELGPGE